MRSELLQRVLNNTKPIVKKKIALEADLWLIINDLIETDTIDLKDKPYTKSLLANESYLIYGNVINLTEDHVSISFKDKIKQFKVNETTIKKLNKYE